MLRNDTNTQAWFAKPLIESGLASDLDLRGLCFGFAICAIEATLVNDLNHFKMLNLLYQPSPDLADDSNRFSITKLIRLVNSLEEKLKLSSQAEINDVSNKLLYYRNILDFMQTFFANVYAHQFPIRHPDIRVATHLQQPEISSEILASPELKSKGGMKSLKPFSGVYTKSSLKEHFASLQKLLDQKPLLPHPFAMLLEGSDHSINISYDPASGHWILLDANQEPRLTKNIDDVTNYCLRAFFEARSTMFVTHVKTTGATFEMVTEKLEAWQATDTYKENHHVFKERIMIENGHGENWLHLAAEAGELEVIKKICEIAPSTINNQAQTGATPFVYALLWRQTPALHLLIAKGADIDVGKYNSISTCFIAGYTSNKRMLTQIIKQKFSSSDQLNKSMQQLEQGENYKKSHIDLLQSKANIFAAAQSGHMETFLKHFNSAFYPNALHETTGRAPIHIAAFHNNFEIVEKLLSAGCDIDLVSRDGDTPLMMAVAGYNSKLALWLIEKGADTNHKNNRDFSVLHYAAKSGLTEVMQAMGDLSLSINMHAGNKNTPLQLAIFNRHVDAVDYLLGAGADAFAEGEREYSAFRFITRNSLQLDLDPKLLQKDILMMKALLHAAKLSSAKKMMPIAELVISRSRLADSELIHLILSAAKVQPNSEKMIELLEKSIANNFGSKEILDYNGPISQTKQTAFRELYQKCIELNRHDVIAKFDEMGLKFEQDIDDDLSLSQDSTDNAKITSFGLFKPESDSQTQESSDKDGLKPN